MFGAEGSLEDLAGEGTWVGERLQVEGPQEAEDTGVLRGSASLWGLDVP